MSQFNTSQVLKFSIEDFRKKIKGSHFGLFWMFVTPLITVILYWFVFQIGFRSFTTPDGLDFVPWLIFAMVPWFFFSEAWSAATNCLFEYNFLVKKVAFRIVYLPIIKIISSFYIHLFFLGFAIVIAVVYGIYPSLYWLQLLYYLICLSVLLVALSLITCAITPFFKDAVQIISLILQIGFWITPIVWSLTMVPDVYIGLFKSNPFYYIVEGYRDSFFSREWFWDKGTESLLFWGVTLILLAIGIFSFKKLKPHFADII